MRHFALVAGLLGCPPFFVSEGVVVRKAYSSAPMTRPSVTSMMSGRLPQDVIVQDPFEQSDLSDSQPDRVERMVEHYASWCASLDLERHEGRDIEQSEGDLGALEALGYTGGEEE
jgi:hypothetical protein